VLLALLLGVALVVVLQQLRRADRTQAAERFAEARMSFAPDSVEVLGRIDPRLRETSGLATSTREGAAYWSHNDSGDDALLYALDPTGAVVAVFELADVEARDWEALDRGACPADETASCLFVADTGDNVRRRDVLLVHVVPEPDPMSGGGTVEVAGTLRYLYPDGARDAEGVAVAADGSVVVVTKGRVPEIRLFVIDGARVREAVATDTPVRLGAGVALPIVPDWDVGRVVTGAAFSPDGSVLAVRTLSEIYFYGWPDLNEVAPPCFLGRREPQGEAIAWQDAGTVILTSETNGRGPGELLRVRCGGLQDPD
jgi:hypothetical protein